MKIKKKIFAGVLTAMMLVLTMGTTVFAAPSPDSDVVLQQKTDEINKATSVDSNAVNSNNEIIKVTATAVTKDQYSAANTVAKGQDSGATVVAMKNISVPEGTNAKKGIKVTIRANGIKSGDNVYVLHQLSSGAWQTLKPDSIASGSVTVTLYSFSPVAVVKYTPGVTPALTGDPSKDENAGTDSDKSNNNENSNTNSNSNSTGSQNNSQSNPQTNNNNQSNSQTNNQNNPVNVNQNVTVKYPDSNKNENYDKGYNDGYTDGASSVKVSSAGDKNSAPYVTSPKTGAALPALPIVAVFAFAGTVVCHRKTRSN
ncbi:MAG: hypothetical protein MR646_04690 [Agathobacter sp.]|nr:hypothetical protein [Agathobacter sp.]